MMRINVLTLFPDMFEAVLGESIIGRAREKKLLEMNFINIRDFSKDKHKKVDDYPYGAGGGMVMAPQPIYDAYMSVASKTDTKPHVIYMSPQGSVFNQQKAKELAILPEIVILCGHYEGIDERIIEEIVDEEISIGDYVLTGGELGSMVIADSIIRLLDGAIANESTLEESFDDNLLEYPQVHSKIPSFGSKILPQFGQNSI